MKRNWRNPELRKKYLKGRRLAMTMALNNKISGLNKKIIGVLESLGIEFIPEYKIGPYSFDVFLPEHNVLLEVQGEYWHALPKNKLRDRQKSTYISRYFPDLKLRYLLEIEFLNMESIHSKICNICGMDFGLQDFDFGDLSISEIKFKQANEFLGMWHYLHGARPGSYFGAFLNDELVAVCGFSMPRNQDKDGGKAIELSRFCIHPSRHKKNFASYFVSKCVKLLPERYTKVISFADKTHGHDGTIYKSMNWKHVGTTKPSYWYIKDDGWVFHKRTVYERAVKMGMKEADYVSRHNLIKCHGNGKLKFEFVRRANVPA